MNEKEFRRLNRRELIEVIYQLEQDVMELQQTNEKLQKELEEKTAEVQNFMSLEQAVERLNQMWVSSEENTAPVSRENRVETISSEVNTPEEEVKEPSVAEIQQTNQQRLQQQKESQQEREARLDEAIRKMEELHRADWNKVTHEHQKR